MSKPSTTELDGIQDSTTMMGQLIAEIMKFHGESKEDASRLATILLPHIKVFAAEKVREALENMKQRFHEPIEHDGSYISIRVIDRTFEERITALTPNTPKGEK